MNKLLLGGALAFSLLAGTSLVSRAQNKTLGVGTTTPNPNAALHVESPTGNQGFIMPRLTTAQRTSAGFTSILTSADNGLMVYDTNESTLYIWDGTAWKSSQQVAQANTALLANALVLPYVDTVGGMPTNSNLIRIVNEGTAVENVGVAQFENTNPNNGFNTLFVRNSGTAGAGYFQNSNTLSITSTLRSITNSSQTGAHGILGRTTGVGGSAGYFDIQNVTNAQPAVLGTTNGAGSGVTGTTTGSGHAGYFEINNPANANSALFAGTNGTGNAITANGTVQATAFVGDGSALTGIPGFTLPYSQSLANGGSLFTLTNTGAGFASIFEINNAANSFSALAAGTNGLGRAGEFSINNPASGSAVLEVNTNGTGNAINANAPIQAPVFIGDGGALTGIDEFTLPYSNTSTDPTHVISLSNTGTGAVANFSISNPANSNSAVIASTNGNGPAGYFSSTDATATASTVFASYAGVGSAFGALVSGNGKGADFQITNATNSNYAVSALTQGIGGAAAFTATDPSNTTPTLTTASAGLGTAGYFETSNGANTSPSILINQLGVGNAITANAPIQATAFVGDGSALTGIDEFTLPYSNTFTNAASGITITNQGTGHAAGFNINNPASNGSAVSASTDGTGSAGLFNSTNTSSNSPSLFASYAGMGSAIESSVYGDGRGATLLIDNASNTNRALSTRTTGLGNAAYFETSNASNNSATLFIDQQGTGNAITANAPVQATSFIGDGSALTGIDEFTLPYLQSANVGGDLLNLTNTGSFNTADFSINNPSNSFNALRASTNGSADAMFVFTTGIASAGHFITMNASSSSPTLFAETDGVGSAAGFTITNAGSAAPVITISHPGSGNAISANAPISASAFVGDGSGLTNLPVSGWGLGGNTGTDPSGGDFIGTSDAQDLAFRTNNSEAMRIYSSGQVGIGASPVSAKLDVSHNANTIGIHAESTYTGGGQNKGIQADASGSPNSNFGVYGTGHLDGSSGDAVGVYGEAIGTGTANAIGVYANTNNFTATTAISYGLFANAEGGATNWAGYFNNGGVHISNDLSVGGSTNFGNSGDVLTSQGPGTPLTWTTPNYFTLPYVQGPTDAGTLLDLTNNGTGSTAQFSSLGGGTPLLISQGSAGSAAGVIIDHNAADGFALEVNSTGGGAANGIDLQYHGSGNGVHSQNFSTTGQAGRFFTSNSSNVGVTLEVETLGQGSAAQFEINNNSSGTPAIVASTNGTANAAFFTITEATNASPVLSLSHSGTGNALTADAPIETTGTKSVPLLTSENAGTGGAAEFTITNATSSANVMYADNQGLGYAGYFRNINASSTGNAILAENYGVGYTFRSFSYGSGDAGLFSVIGSSNASTALDLETAGTGSLLTGTSPAVNTSHAVNFTDAGSGSATMRVDKTGTGASGWFSINNASNNSNTIFASTDGLGATVYSQNTGSSQGAGQFVISNGGNPGAALTASTNGTGPAARLNSSGTGVALEIQSGAVLYPITTISTSIAIPDNAVVVEITTSGLTVSVPSGGQNGQVLYVLYTGSGPTTTVDGQAIATNQWFTFIRVGGVWRKF